MDGFAHTPLHSAAMAGRHEVVQLLTGVFLSVNADDPTPHDRDRRDNSPLFFASLAGSELTVEALLKAGASSGTEGGNLKAAAVSGSAACVKLLLGEEPKLSDTEVALALRFAVRARKEETFTVLLSNLKERESGKALCTSMLALVASWSSKRMLERFLKECQRGAVNWPDKCGISPLSSAAQSGNEEAVRYLLSAGADVFQRDGEYWTPVHSAVMAGQLGVLRVLMDEVPKDHSLRTGQGEKDPLLCVAAKHGHKYIVEELINMGAVIDEECDMQSVALVEASMWGQLPVVQLLLEKRSNHRALGRAWQNALAYAALHGQAAIVTALLQPWPKVNNKKLLKELQEQLLERLYDVDRGTVVFPAVMSDSPATVSRLLEREKALLIPTYRRRKYNGGETHLALVYRRHRPESSLDSTVLKFAVGLACSDEVMKVLLKYIHDDVLMMLAGYTRDDHLRPMVEEARLFALKMNETGLETLLSSYLSKKLTECSAYEALEKQK